MASALTFDDGPHPVNTPAILRILREHHVQATFFVLGSMVRTNPGILNQIASEGLRHVIGNHSFDHDAAHYLPRLTNDQIREQIERTQALINNAIGASRAAKIFCPTGGRITPAQKEFVRRQLGYRLVGWNVDSLDSRAATTVAEVRHNIVANTREGNVVLAHDIHQKPSRRCAARLAS